MLAPSSHAAAEDAVVGGSPLFCRAVALAERYARSAIPVLLVGETGTGKELVARRIHRSSGRRGELVDVDCGALPREMLESLLFGHRRGAFTGAHADAPGLIAAAGGGTLFLDELSSLALEAQAKLLRVIETREVRRLGDTGKRRIDFRLVAAVQADLQSRVADGAFRRDLYHRVAGAVVTLPPLRARPEDLIPLAAHFAAEHGCVVASDAAVVLRRHDWPGNVRELRAIVARATLCTEDGRLDASLFAELIEQQPEADCFRSAARYADPGYARLREVCVAEGTDPGRVAAVLGISRATLYRRLKQLGITLREIAVAQ
jgi:transcriptional regulator with PAS, ATPase and Fis domain